MQKYVAGLMFDTSGEYVALVRKEKPDWQKGYLNAIGGKVESYEGFFDAMIREFCEETGIYKAFWRPLVRLYRKDLYEVSFFIAFSDDVFNVKTMESEEIEVWNVSKIDYNQCISNLKWLIPLALDANISNDKFIEIEDIAGN